LIRCRACQAEKVYGNAFTQTIETGCGKKSRRRCASKEIITSDFRIALPDGTIKYLEVTSHHEFSSLGAMVEAVSTHADVTERKRAQEEHERLRRLESDLAHTNRLSIMGELAASLAHEIAQPIATARNNSRASMHFLDRSPPDLGQVREALTCVVNDADRAGDFLDRSRAIPSPVPRQQSTLSGPGRAARTGSADRSGTANAKRPNLKRSGTMPLCHT
jgi:hypothetical protein